MAQPTQRTGRHATHGECTDHPGPRFLARRVGVGRSRREAASRRPRRHGADAAGPRVEGRRPVGDHLRGPRRRDHRSASRRPIAQSSSPSTARPGSAATRRATSVPERIAAMVYVDTAPGKAAARRRVSTAAEKPFVWARSRRRRTSTGSSDEQKATFRERAVPVPGGVLQRGPRVHERCPPGYPRRPSSRPATSAEDYQKYAKEHPDWAFLAGIPELRNVSWVDLPTSHWPMWSKPAELAKIIGDVATAAGDAR